MGLGAGFARQLTGHAINLILVDIQTQPLTQTTGSLQQQFNVDIRPFTLDLETADFLPNLIHAVSDLEVGLLVNNAGISAIGHFLDVPLEKHLSILDINARPADTCPSFRRHDAHPATRRHHLCLVHVCLE